MLQLNAKCRERIHKSPPNFFHSILTECTWSLPATRYHSFCRTSPVRALPVPRSTACSRAFAGCPWRTFPSRSQNRSISVTRSSGAMCRAGSPALGPGVRYWNRASTWQRHRFHAWFGQPLHRWCGACLQTSNVDRKSEWIGWQQVKRGRNSWTRTR